MTCPVCSATVLAPMVEGGISPMKAAERLRRTVPAIEAEGMTLEHRTAIHEAAALIVLLGHEVARLSRPNPAG